MVSFPIKSTNISTDQVRRIECLDIRQSSGVSTQFNLTTPATVTAQVTVWNINPMPGRIFVIEQINIQVNKTCQLVLATSADAIYNEPVWANRFTAFANTSITIPLNLKIPGNQSLYLAIQNIGDPTNVTVTGGISGYETVQDYDWNADEQILFVGDSQTYGASIAAFGGYNRSDIWTFKTLDYFRDKGKSIRPVIDAAIGSTTGQIENRRLAGQLDKGLKPLTICYYAGVNNTDATGGTLAGYRNALAHYTSFIDWKIKRHPQANLLMISPPPVLNTSRETDVAAIRLLMKQAVDNVNGASNKIYYADGSLAYNGQDTTNYNGDGLHHNVLGSLRFFNNTVKPVLDTLTI